VNDEKILAWLQKGAQPTDQVHRLLVNAGIWERYESERKRESRAVRTAAARSKGAAGRDAEKAAAAKVTAVTRGGEGRGCHEAEARPAPQPRSRGRRPKPASEGRRGST
jgi:hypothetical protein